MQLRFVLGRNVFVFAAALVAVLSLVIASMGQEPGKTMPVTPAPAASSTPPAHTTYTAEQVHLLLTDFGDLERFQAADAALPPPAPGEDRVVFMGDSITEGWKIEGPGGTFPGKPYINRGISGQTTPQMLVRFRQDVIDLKPKVVIILAGTNDIAENTGPMTLQETEENLASMADLASSNHIRVVLCSITPAFDFPWRPGLDPAAKIPKVNAWIQAYAAEKGYIYVDYYAALKDARGGLPSNLSHDGVHPNPAAYAIMAPLAEAGIQMALAQPAQ
jgi:acyl-CoA thioesterase I